MLPIIHVERFTLLQVNQVQVRVAPGGSHPLCQAIPITEIHARLRWHGATSTARRGLRVTISVPGHAARGRRLTLTHTTGTREQVFTPRTEHLRDEAFPAGRYVVTVRRGRHLLERASMRLDESVAAC